MKRIVLVLTGALVMAGMLAINASTALSKAYLDKTFGDKGYVNTNFFSGEFRGSEDDARGIAIQPDGKMIAAGTAERVDQSNWANDFALARYNTDGSMDTSFGNGGKVTTAFSDNNSDNAYGVALQHDGKIVVAGSAWDGSSWNFALARYNSDGSMDTSFGSGGKLTTDFSGGDDEAHAVALQQDGKIVAGGVNRQVVPPGGYFSNYDFALARYNTDGSLDTSFDGDGKVTTDFSGWSDEAHAIALQQDGKIVAAGSAYSGSTVDVALARYNTDGSLDTSFDGDGKVTTDFSGLDDYANAVTIQKDGKIVAAGRTTDPSTSQSGLAMARYNSDGSLDTTYGTNTHHIGLDGDEIDDLAVQQDGKVVAAGRTITSNTNYYDFALARYLP